MLGCGIAHGNAQLICSRFFDWDIEHINKTCLQKPLVFVAAHANRFRAIERIDDAPVFAEGIGGNVKHDFVPAARLLRKRKIAPVHVKQRTHKGACARIVAEKRSQAQVHFVRRKRRGQRSH